MKKTDKISLLMIIVLIFIVAGGCDKNDTKMPYSCDPHAVCDNISKNEWKYLGLGDKSITSVAVHPCNPQVIFAGSKDGKTFRSIDCGATWDLIYDEGGRVTEIIVDPQNPYIIYANSRGVIRSKDGGTIWQFAHEGIPSGLAKIVISLEIDHVNTRRLYVGTGCPWGPTYLYYTDNRGDFWHPVPGFSFEDTLINDNHLLHNEVFSFSINPADNYMLYAGTGSGTGRINYVLHSTDRGMNWDKVISFEDSIPRWFNSSAITFSRDSKYVYVFMRLKGLLKSDVISNDFYEIQMPDSIIQTTQFGMAFNENDNLILCTGLGIFKYDGNILIDYNNNLPHRDTRALYLTNQNNVYTGLEAKTKGGVYVRRID